MINRKKWDFLANRSGRTRETTPLILTCKRLSLVDFFFFLFVQSALLALVELLDPARALIHAPVDCRRNGECTANDGADARKEPDQGLSALFAVDNLHR